MLGGHEEEEAIELGFVTFFLLASWRKFVVVRLETIASLMALFSKLFNYLFLF